MSIKKYNLIFFDFEIFKYDWLVVFNIDSQEEVIVNDCEALRKFINSHSDCYFIGFNNYNYDDIVCHKILDGENPYEISQAIFNNREKYKIDYLYKSIDLTQDLKRISLKKIEANLGLNIQETSVDFNIDKKLTLDEIEDVIKYCKNDVKATKYFYKYREDYINTKLGIISDFDLEDDCIRFTENQLATKILNCKPYEILRDDLRIDYCNDIDLDLIPKEIIDFYNEAEYDYLYNCEKSKNIMSKQLKVNLLGCPTKYGFGGIHSALKNETKHGNILQIDFSSFYPTIMINYNYFSRAISNTDKYKEIYYKRLELKNIDVEKSNRYKLILNKPYGCMKNEFHILRDVMNCNKIVINGQLIVTQLVIELKEYCELLQTNTDSITIKYYDKCYEKVKEIVDNFCERFNLKYSELKVNDLYQIDVNNYIIVDENKNIKCKGSILKNYNPKDNKDLYYNNSLSIIDKCSVEYLVNRRSVEEVVMECYNNNEIDRFQLITSYGNKFIGTYLEYDGIIKKLDNKVNRVFATKDKKYGKIYKRKKELKEDEDDYDVKIPKSFNHNYVFNNDLKYFDKSILDLEYYIKLCKKTIPEEV